MKQFLKQWPLLAFMAVALVLIYGGLASQQDQDRADTEKAIRLINPPAEVVEGRVEKIVTVSEYDLATGTELEHGTAYFCSGQVWPIPDHQLDEISEWLRVYAPNRGCK